MTLLSDIIGSSGGFSADEIKNYLQILNLKLKNLDKRGEISIVGGAMMCLVFQSRKTTYDIDAAISPSQLMQKLILEVAEEYNLPKYWLNENVIQFMSPAGEFTEYLKMSNLDVYTATPEYMLAMKALSARFENINEVDDIQTLIKYLKLKTPADVYKIIKKFYQLHEYQSRFDLILKEIFSE